MGSKFLTCQSFVCELEHATQTAKLNRLKNTDKIKKMRKKAKEKGFPIKNRNEWFLKKPFLLLYTIQLTKKKLYLIEFLCIRYDKLHFLFQASHWIDDLGFYVDAFNIHSIDNKIHLFPFDLFRFFVEFSVSECCSLCRIY